MDLQSVLADPGTVHTYVPIVNATGVLVTAPDQALVTYAFAAAPNTFYLRFKPRRVMDRHWERVCSHLYRNHALLGLGADVNAAVEFTATGARVWSCNTVVVFDSRFASYALGTNGALSKRYVRLDTLVEGDAILL